MTAALRRGGRPWPREKLAPLTPLYRLALALRELGLRTGLQPVRRLHWPVIGIGNLSTGGAGKTPLTIALSEALTGRGLHVDVLSRGYGRASREAMRVDPNGTAEEFGDEPIEIARATGLPVYVAAQRYEAGLLAERAAQLLATPVGPGHEDVSEITSQRHEVSGHDFSRAEDAAKRVRALAPAGNSSIHLLDDGFQHRQLYRDIDILLLNGSDWNDRLLPAGNLREPLRAANRASCIAIPAEDRDLEAELKAWGWQGPIWRMHRRMEVPHIDGPIVAFCGIARPEQFLQGLQNAGIQLAAQIAFPDHHRYTERDIERLQTAARAASATAFITTEKDRVRMGVLAQRFPEFFLLKTAGLRVEIENEDAALEWLLNGVTSLLQHSGQ